MRKILKLRNKGKKEKRGGKKEKEKGEVKRRMIQRNYAKRGTKKSQIQRKKMKLMGRTLMRKSTKSSAL